MGMTNEVPTLTGRLEDHERRIRELEFMVRKTNTVTTLDQQATPQEVTK